MSSKDRPRLFVTAAVFILFGWMLYHNPENEMIMGALIGALATAVGYWLGSSKGSSDKATTIADHWDEPTDVHVVNDRHDPVPTEPQP